MWKLQALMHEKQSECKAIIKASISRLLLVNKYKIFNIYMKPDKKGHPIVQYIKSCVNNVFLTRPYH